MAFVLDVSESYEWPVKITLPMDGGRKMQSTLKIEYRRLPQSRIQEIQTAVRLQDRHDYEGEIIADIDAAKEIICGWADVHDADGEDIPFNEADLDRLLDVPTVAGQLVKQWFESLEGKKAKN